MLKYILNMNIALIGNTLANLVLSKVLIKKGIKVCVYHTKDNFKISPTRTIAISKSNVEYLNDIGLDLSKFSWPVKNIKIYNEKNKIKELLNFKNKEKYLFLLVSNKYLSLFLEKDLKKNKKFSRKIINKKFNYFNLLEKKYNLIINSDTKNSLSKKFFSKRLKKDYKSKAITTIIKHKKNKNNCAYQVFTKFGPLAFLPYSENKTSVVFSFRNSKKEILDHNIKNIISEYNKFYKIKSFSIFEKFNLDLSLSKRYYYKNILCFSDNLHRIHPLAGQGFNMTLRDIKTLEELIDKTLELGLPLDSRVLKDFCYNTKHLNQIFSAGIDMIYEFFRLENKIENIYTDKIIKYFRSSKFFNDQIPKFADKGLYI